MENVTRCPPLSLADVFFSVSLALMVASLLETVLITHIQLSSTHGAMPDWFRTLVLEYGAVLVCLPPSKKKRTVTVFLNPSATGTGGNFLLFWSKANIQIRSETFINISYNMYCNKYVFKFKQADFFCQCQNQLCLLPATQSKALRNFQKVLQKSHLRIFPWRN